MARPAGARGHPHAAVLGAPVRYLGANVSAETVVGRIIDLGSRAVLVSASLSPPHRVAVIEAVCDTGTPVI